MPNQKIILKYDRKTIEVDGRKANEDLENIDLAKDALDRFNNDELDIAALEAAYPQEWAQFLQVMELYAAGRWIQPEYWAQILAVILTMLKEISNGDFDDSLYTDFQGNKLGGSAPERPRVAPIRYAWVETGEQGMRIKPSDNPNDSSTWLTVPKYDKSAWATHHMIVLPVNSDTFIIISGYLDQQQNTKITEAGKAILCSRKQVKMINRPALPHTFRPIGAYDSLYYYSAVVAPISTFKRPFGPDSGDLTNQGFINYVKDTTSAPESGGTIQNKAYETVPHNYYFPGHWGGSGKQASEWREYGFDPDLSDQRAGVTASTYVKSAWHQIVKDRAPDLGMTSIYDAAGHGGFALPVPAQAVTGLYGANIYEWRAQEDVYIGWGATAATNYFDCGHDSFCFGSPAQIALASGAATHEAIESWCVARSPNAKSVFVAENPSSTPNYLTRIQVQDVAHTVRKGPSVSSSQGRVTSRSDTVSSEPLWYALVEQGSEATISFTLTNRRPAYSTHTVEDGPYYNYQVGGNTYYGFTTRSLNMDTSCFSIGTGWGIREYAQVYDKGWWWGPGENVRPEEGDVTVNIKIRGGKIPTKTMEPVVSIHGTTGRSETRVDNWNQVLEYTTVGQSTAVIGRSYNQTAVFSYAGGKSWKDELMAIGFAEADLSF